MPADLQLVQLRAVAAIFFFFGLAEILIGKFFPPEAGREDHRLDIAVGLMFPLVSVSVFAAARDVKARVTDVPSGHGAGSGHVQGEVFEFHKIKNAFGR